MVSSVGHGVEGRADLLTAAGTELAESFCEYGFRHGGQIVEGRSAVVIDSFVDSHRDAGGDGSLVTGATMTLLSTGMTSSRETTSTGRRFWLGVSTSQSSAWATKVRLQS